MKSFVEFLNEGKGLSEKDIIRLLKSYDYDVSGLYGGKMFENNFVVELEFEQSYDGYEVCLSLSNEETGESSYECVTTFTVKSKRELEYYLKEIDYKMYSHDEPCAKFRDVKRDLERLH